MAPGEYEIQYEKVIEECVRNVVAVFPDIDLDYACKQSTKYEGDFNSVINRIIELQDQGTSYERRQTMATLKRKRGSLSDEDEDEEGNDDLLKQAKRKYENPLRKAIPRSEKAKKIM